MAVGIPASVRRKLEALQYRSMNTLSLDGDEYKKAIVWLEEEKIRLLEKKDRQRLHRFDKTWHRALQEYCKEIGAKVDTENWKFEESAEVRLQVLDSLLSLAVHDIYQDKRDAAEIKMPPVEKVDEEQAERQLSAFIAPLNRIFTAWGLPLLPEDSRDPDIGAGIECVNTRIQAAEGDKLGDELTTFNIGIDTEDEEVNKMVAILRLMHGKELRSLQYNINNIITQLQELTADPKTDSRLGRVGR